MMFRACLRGVKIKVSWNDFCGEGVAEVFRNMRLQHFKLSYGIP